MSDVGDRRVPGMETDRDDIENQRPPLALESPGVGETVEVPTSSNTLQVAKDPVELCPVSILAISRPRPRT